MFPTAPRRTVLAMLTAHGSPEISNEFGSIISTIGDVLVALSANEDRFAPSSQHPRHEHPNIAANAENTSICGRALASLRVALNFPFLQGLFLKSLQYELWAEWWLFSVDAVGVSVFG